MTDPAPVSARPAVRWSVTAVIVAALVWAFVDSWREAGGIELAGAPQILLAGASVVGSLLFAAAAWAQLIRRPLRATLPDFLVAQLARYVPGSVWQGVGQVVGATRLGVGRGTASVAYVVQLVTQLVAACMVGMLVLLGDPPVWLATLAWGAPLLLVLMLRPVMARAVWLLTRLAPRRLGHLPATVPPQARIVRAVVLGAGGSAMSAAAFVALLPDGLVSSPAATAGAFAAAWAAGFLVVPVPAGLGVRELVLLGALGPGAGTATVLAAAVLHRLVSIGAEAVATAVGRVALRGLAVR